MKIKTGDTVIVTSGQYKGKTGKVLQVFTKTNRVIVEKVNMVTKHQKPSGQQRGGIMHREGSIHASNVKLVEGKSSKKTKK